MAGDLYQSPGDLYRSLWRFKLRSGREVAAPGPMLEPLPDRSCPNCDLMDEDAACVCVEAK